MGSELMNRAALTFLPESETRCYYSEARWKNSATVKEASSGLSLMALFRDHMQRGLVRLSPRSRRRAETRVSAESLESRVLLFVPGTRWSNTATNGSGLVSGDATTVTWSIVADGTPIPAMGGISGESSDSSNLVAFLSGIYGTVTADTNYTDEVWFSHLQSTFDRWSELSGLTFTYVAYDDGAAFTLSMVCTRRAGCSCGCPDWWPSD